MDTNNLINEFYEKFNIEPIIKEGQPFMSMDCRVATCIATEDIYPEFNVQRAWEIEEFLIGREDFVNINIEKDNTQNVYQYVVEENGNDGEDYHHGFANVLCKTRLEALMAYLIQYGYIQDIYDMVRDIFGQNLKSTVTSMVPNMTQIEKIEATYSPIDWVEYDEQEQ